MITQEEFDILRKQNPEIPNDWYWVYLCYKDSKKYLNEELLRVSSLDFSTPEQALGVVRYVAGIIGVIDQIDEKLRGLNDIKT